ncbi:MAG: ADOP family duplicated permease, partial [Gemmatimonadales bacterium]
MDTLLQDIRYALRTLMRAPAFTAAAVATLALGIGANTAVFSVVNSVLLRPLPYDATNRVHLLVERHERGEFRLLSYPTFLDWQGQTDALDGLAFMRGTSALLRGGEGPMRVGAAFVSEGFFELLTGRPLHGRLFVPDDERPAGSHVAVITYDLWQRRFGGDPAVLGTAMSLDDGSYTIIGILPSGVRYPDWVDFYAPLAAIIATDSALHQRGLHADSRVVARLRAGVDTVQTRVALEGVAARLAAAYPKEHGGWTSVAMLPLREEVLGFGAVRPVLRLLQVAVMLVVLIVCANVASMALVRGATRSRELAIRSALGAGRARVVRQLLTEAGVLALSGGALGVLLAAWLLDLLKAAAPEGLPRLDELRIDGWVLAVAGLTSLLTAALVGLAPALRVTSTSLVASLKEGRVDRGAGSRRSTLRSTVVAAEIAIAVVLLLGAGLLVRSFWRLSEVDLGFNPRRLVSLQVFPPAGKYESPDAAAGLYRRLAEAVAPVPGVEATALSNHVPLSGGGIPSRIVVPGHVPTPDEGESVFFRTVSADYFDTMQIPLRQGRMLTQSDVASRATVVVVNETLARRYWSGASPIGRSVTLFKAAQARPDYGERFAAAVVGVVGDVRHFGLEQDPPAEVYVPYTVNVWGHMTLVVRTRADPGAMLPVLRRAVLGVEP